MKLYRYLPPMLFACVLGINNLGSSLTTFGLAAWIFEVTGSYAAMTLLGIITPLTVVLVSPVAGLVVDRYNKKWILIAADSFSLISILISLSLYLNDVFSTPLAMALAWSLSICNEFRFTASSALIPSITAKENLLRVNSVQQSFRGSALMLGPILGAVSFSYLGLSLLLAIDALTFVISAGILLSFSSTSR